MARKKEPACETEKYIFPSRLRKLMAETKTTQRELAQAIGVRPQTVSLYAQGQSFPDVNGLAKIASYFCISADYLIGNSDLPNEDMTMQAIHKITGLSAMAIGKLQDIFEENEKTAFSDIISLLIEDSNFEYFLSLLHNRFLYSAPEYNVPPIIKTENGKWHLKNAQEYRRSINESETKIQFDDLVLIAKKKTLLDSMITTSLIADINRMAETYLEQQKKKGGH